MESSLINGIHEMHWEYRFSKKMYWWIEIVLGLFLPGYPTNSWSRHDIGTCSTKLKILSRIYGLRIIHLTSGYPKTTHLPKLCFMGHWSMAVLLEFQVIWNKHSSWHFSFTDYKYKLTYLRNILVYRGKAHIKILFLSFLNSFITMLFVFYFCPPSLKPICEGHC